MTSELQHLLLALLGLAVLAVAAATLGSLAARLWWRFDLLANFRAHYVLVGASLASIALAAGSGQLAALSLGIVFLHLPVLRTLLFSRGASPKCRGNTAYSGPLLEITTINLLRGNQRRSAAVDFIRDQSPDILIVQEADGEWRRHLVEIKELYQYSAPSCSWRSSSILLFSNYPILNTKHIIAASSDSSFILAEIQVENRRLFVIPVHLDSPQHADDAENRNRQLEDLASCVNSIKGPLIVAGDFNTTRWSPHFEQLLRSTGLHNCADGRGWLPTWPTFLPVFAIPIDHILTNSAVAALSMSRGHYIGSDHWPLAARLQLLSSPEIAETY